MSYSEKVIDHYNEPRNVGSLDKDDPNVGTGLIGAPQCGDVLKFQILVGDDGKIVDTKAKTFGCLAGNSRICTPFGYKRIRDLKVHDAVWAWNGTEIVTNSIVAIKESEWDVSDLLKIEFESSRHPLICSKDHVWWGADNKPVLASDLSVGDELLEMTSSELRGLNNIGRHPEMRSMSSARMHEFNKTFDRSSLPQNQKGYKHKESEKKSLAAKTNWLMRPEYRKNWQEGMAKIDWTERPTKLEKRFIELFEEHGIDARYVGDYSFWHNRANPDFKVNGQNKFIEVYDSKMPWQDRSGEEWKKARAEQLGVYGFKTLFLDVRDIDNCISEVQRFIHNGSKVLSIDKVKNLGHKKNSYFNEDERSSSGKVKLYDLSLCEGANIFFVDRVMSHNCGSAIASASLTTEWVKGKSIEEALEIKNTEIVDHLSLPPVKIHCSVLCESAIKAAIADYRKKQESRLIDGVSDSVASDLDVYESKPE